MLDKVEAALAAAGVGSVRLDGKTPASQRPGIIRQFQNAADDSPRVILVSLKVGGVGLNLTAGSSVHLLDPFWNPFVEEQASGLGAR